MLKLTAKREQWFVLEDEDPTGETKLKIRYLKPGEMAEINEKHNKVVGKASGDDFIAEVATNPGAVRREVLKRAVVDWEGFLDEKDKKLPCNEINKLKVNQEFDWFYTKVEELLDIMKGKAESDEEGAEKNS